MSNVLRIKTHSHWMHVEEKAEAKIFFDVYRSLSLPPSLSFCVNMSLNLIRVKSYRPKKAETVTMCCPAGHASITCPDPSHICTRSTCSVHQNINRLVLQWILYASFPGRVLSITGPWDDPNEARATCNVNLGRPSVTRNVVKNVVIYMQQRDCNNLFLAKKLHTLNVTVFKY